MLQLAYASIWYPLLGGLAPRSGAEGPAGAACAACTSKLADLEVVSQTADMGITFDGTAPRTELHAYSDSDWSVEHATSGHAVLFCGAVIGYGSRRPPCALRAREGGGRRWRAPP